MENLDIDKIDIANFKSVNNWLFRGGQPNKAQLIDLSKLGVKSVVSLRYNSDVLRQEKKICRDLNLNYFPIPLSYVVKPNKNQISKFFNILKNPGNHAVFVHCKHGCDRTGLLIAMYRIVFENYSFNLAYQEMLDMGFHKLKMFHFKFILKEFAQHANERLKFI